MVSPDDTHVFILVVSDLALGCGRVCLEPVSPAPEQLEAPPVPHDRIERRQQADGVRRRVGRWPLAGGPVPVDALDARA